VPSPASLLYNLAGHGGAGLHRAILQTNVASLAALLAAISLCRTGALLPPWGDDDRAKVFGCSRHSFVVGNKPAQPATDRLGRGKMDRVQAAHGGPVDGGSGIEQMVM